MATLRRTRTAIAPKRGRIHFSELALFDGNGLQVLLHCRVPVVRAPGGDREPCLRSSLIHHNKIYDHRISSVSDEPTKRHASYIQDDCH